jgi:hypothetical protein
MAKFKRARKALSKW